MPIGKNRAGASAADFLNLGVTTFWVPGAHLAMIKEAFVRCRHWLSPEAFVDMTGATNLGRGPRWPCISATSERGCWACWSRECASSSWRPFLLVRFKWNSAILIALGALIGLMPMH